MGCENINQTHIYYIQNYHADPRNSNFKGDESRFEDISESEIEKELKIIQRNADKIWKTNHQKKHLKNSGLEEIM